MPVLFSELTTLLATLATAYSVDFQHDGTWHVLNASGAIVYRGSQKEAWRWLNQQPTS